MSFLDNAGTIILDAILTDVGRQRLAQGNFQVTKFSLGDDEIDYTLYKAPIANNTAQAWTSFSDPAGYLILSQSCFEAFNNTSATINYGLTSFERNDLLYLPELKINYSGSAITGQPHEHPGIARPVSGSVFYLAVNSETSKKLKSALGSTNYILESLGYNKTKIVIESGIPTDQLPGNLVNSRAFIVQPAVLDTYYYVHVDSRFFVNIIGSGTDAVFKNRTNGKLEMNFKTFKPHTRISITSPLDKFDSYMVAGAPNRVYSTNNTDTLTDRSISAIAGPRGTVMALGLTIVNEIGGSSTTTRNEKYTIFGKNDQTLFGGSDKYDYIDTTIYVKGATTGAQVQIPLRIIRYAGT
jgi:hypothetical protein|tara:strand:- start:1819 stop:2880 length:1062 start_codon:yes stop_codon:yes gene_type:complete